ncbi:MAG TPA: winged helix DNA-binding domain-containing protein [Actinotalea caeni]|uniref:winged helix DNA-binding domain-containing protein n=1 Tax=Actinotalea caeni TaxID=1348467 RepID=UPI0012E1D758|nr:winged helix DNA-binding domain-containing protein [Actinotalea caeni]HLV55724.1 winged helix DNA-binding domain-containing protein [Actinotalea caeni]
MSRRSAPAPVRHVDDDERRARLGRRHGLAPGHRFGDVVTAAASMVGLHATEPATVHLSLWARSAGLALEDVERALYDDRVLVKQTAMRGTLFAVDRGTLPAVWGSVAARQARALHARLVKDLLASGVTDDGEAWLAEMGDAVVALLREQEAGSTEVRRLLPAVDVSVTRGTGAWSAATPVAPQLLWLLNERGRVLRSRNAGDWVQSRPRWRETVAWLGEPAVPAPAREAYARLVRGWLRTYGPGTEADLRWWLGDTLGAVRTALADLDAVPVTVSGPDGGPEPAWLLPDDLDTVEPPDGWVALLPTLDPTVMGWRGRGFYVGPHRDALFDSVGNAGTTAWWDGRVVGSWMQDPQGRVHLHLLEDLPAAVRRALEEEAARLTAWLDGAVVTRLYVSGSMRLALPGR